MMMRLSPLPREFAITRDALKRVAVHILARRRHDVTGRFGLRPSPVGIATPAFGDDAEVVRTHGAYLIHESGGRTSVAPLTSLSAAAAMVGVDLAADLNVGHDTPPTGDPDTPVTIDASSAAALADWYRVVALALDATVATLPTHAAASVAQLWPEHFDVALDVAWGEQDGQRVNLGGSPGDSFEPDPYAYVGPWGAERPLDPDYWNAPFGAVLRYSDVDADDSVNSLVAFYRHGWELLKR